MWYLGEYPVSSMPVMGFLDAIVRIFFDTLAAVTSVPVLGFFLYVLLFVVVCGLCHQLISATRMGAGK